MAMLAGPRRKQKVINLRAKNSVWSNDQNKFGQRMLEKMGWSAGKGLGANENGIVEHVIARYKNDEKGLGFEDKNDQWTKHEDDFNALLSNLSQASGGEEKLHSGISLEDKSKKSKARVHYHKFTRGKDLTRYSEKDLANIFGKKSLKDEKKNTELILKEDVKTTGQIFTEKGSMEDYFKSKLASLKTKSKLLTCESTVAENSDYVFKGFSMDLQYNDNDSLNDNDLNKHEANNIVLHEETAVLSKKVKNKKSKKKKNKCTNEAEFEEAIVCNDITILKNVDDGSEGDSKAKSKKKKNKYKNESELEETIVCDDSTLLNTVEDNRSKDGNKSKSKKSKRKNKDPNLNECHVVSSEFQDDQLEEHNYIPKKKKKKKIKHSEIMNSDYDRKTKNGEKRKFRSPDRLSSSSNSVDYSPATCINEKDLEDLRTVYKKCKKVMEKIESKYGHLLNIKSDSDVENDVTYSTNDTEHVCKCSRNKKIRYDDNGEEYTTDVILDTHICPLKVEMKNNNDNVQSPWVEFESAEPILPDNINTLSQMLQDRNLEVTYRNKIINKLKTLRDDITNEIRFNKKSLVQKIKSNPNEVVEFAGANLGNLPGYFY